MEASRQVRRRTPSPGTSDEEEPLVNLSITPPPLAANQKQDNNVGSSACDIALRQAAVNVAHERKTKE